MSTLSLKQAFDADLRGVEVEVPGVFSVSRDGSPPVITSYAGSFTENVTGRMMDDAGYLADADFLLLARVSVFGSDPIPLPQSFVTVETLQYRITAVTFSQDKVSITFGLSLVN